MLRKRRTHVQQNVHDLRLEFHAWIGDWFCGLLVGAAGDGLGVGSLLNSGFCPAVYKTSEG